MYYVHACMYMYVSIYLSIHLFISSRCMEDASLSYTLRAVFCCIMQCVYLDTTPQEGVNPVEYSRLWDHIPQEAITQKYCPWYICTCTYVHVHVHVYVYVCKLCMYVCVRMYICMYMYVCMYVHMYVCMYVCVYMYVHMYVYMYNVCTCMYVCLHHMYIHVYVCNYVWIYI